MLAAERGADEARLEAFVSTRCQLSSRGSKRICGEQITIEAAGAAVDTASTAVAPLLVPDVPVFLWWKDIPHYDDKLFNAPRGDGRPRRHRLGLVRQPARRPAAPRRALLADGRLRLSDLNWGRLTSWRALVAGFWDVADYRDSLAQIEKIVIEYDPPDRSHDEIAPKALLALGWIASCLGWEVAGSGSTFDDRRARFILQDGGREIEAVLAATADAAGRDGWLTSFTISTAAGDEFFVGLHHEEGRLRTGARLRGAGHTCERVLGYEARTEGERLGGELDILSRDDVYESAVARRGAAARSGRRVSRIDQFKRGSCSDTDDNRG